MRKKTTRNKKSKELELHLYGILDTKEEVMLAISLDQTEIRAEIALMGGLPKGVVECELKTKISI